MKFTKSLLFALIFSARSEAGIINWLSKHDNTITAGITGTLASVGTLVGLVNIPRTILDSYKIKNPLRTFANLGTPDITNSRWQSTPKYIYNNTGNIINKTLNGLTIALSFAAGYITYKKTKEYLEKNKAD